MLDTSAASRSERTPFRWPKGWVPTILIIDDDVISRRVLDTRLRATGCRVVQAENGREGLSRARQERPDLIVLDWMMPEMDGPEFCTMLKADDVLKATHVIMLTAKGETASLVKAFESGADDYIAKPYEPEVLMVRIAAGLQTRALQRHVEEINAQLRQTNARLVEHQQLQEEDLNHAAKFVRAMLPPSGPIMPGVRLAWRFTPSLRLGGDIFNAYPFNEHLVGLYILDMSGHGVGAALRAVSTATILQAGWGATRTGSGPIGLGWRETDPAQILSHLDRLMPSGDDGEHFTIWLGVWDRRTGIMTYASAGHPAPILVRADGAVERLGEPSLPLGFSWIPQSGHNATVTLVEGDRLILFSDGLFEAFSADGEPWGIARLEDACRKTHHVPLEAALTAIVQEVQDWQQGASFRDDLAIMAFQVGRQECVL